MGRSPCCEKVGLKKGPWTPEEDQKLLAYIEEHGHGSWRALPAKAGLQRCGKSCRLRWTNYLRPDIKRGKFSLQEEQTIIQLHALLGNRWSAIAAHLPKRTDNEIKNYWNTHLKKRLTKMGIDPVTHKPKSDALGSGHSKDAANLSHMAQWESARLEAEARLVRESKLVSNPYHSHPLGSSPAPLLSKATVVAPPKMPPCLDVLKAWQGAWTTSTRPTTSTKDNNNNNNPHANAALLNSFFSSTAAGTLESPTSTLNFSDNMFNIPSTTTIGFPDNPAAIGAALGFVENQAEITKEDVQNDWNKCLAENQKIIMASSAAIMHHHHQQQQLPEMAAAYPIDVASYISDTLRLPGVLESFTDDLIPENNADDDHHHHHHSLTSSSNGQSSDDQSLDGVGNCGGDFEENKNYWNNILNLVTLQSGSPVF